MILNPEWLKPKEKPYFHQISLVCIGRLIECVGRIDKGELAADTSSKMESNWKILRRKKRGCSYAREV